jgi:acetate kinase
MKILVLNAGSSSLKSSLYDFPGSEHPIWEGSIDWNHQPGVAELKIAAKSETLAYQDRFTVVGYLLSTLPGEVEAVGHRVVHGGEQYRQSVRITPEVKAAIADLAKFAPVHNPVNLEGIEAIGQVLGSSIPQVAVFDTAFHAHLSPAAFVYPGPYEWLEQGIRRYGFHGISHQYCAARTAQLLGRTDLKLITCHLGNGCSVSAIHNGLSIDTTMGFTPLEGLMMGSRSGSVDPGILIHLLRQGITVDQLDQLLNKSSGLLGISGISSDIRPILESDQPRAQLALEIYVHRIRAAIGAMLPSLNGLDSLVFTAGVGENAAMIRAKTCESFEFLGLQLDDAKNQAAPVDQDISTIDSKVRVFVIHTREEFAIARDCWAVLHPEIH